VLLPGFSGGLPINGSFGKCQHVSKRHIQIDKLFFACGRWRQIVFTGGIRIVSPILTVLVCPARSTFCGTPEYLAPEVLLKEPYGRAVDWYGLGAVTYEMLVGLPPFYSRDFNIMYRRILHEQPRFPSHLSPAARAMLLGVCGPSLTLRSACAVDSCYVQARLSTHVPWSTA
jgi:serine/threonine protein kinase